MKNLQSFLIILFGLIIAVSASILTMIYGWGLTPKSWWWIIGMGIFGPLFGMTIMKIGEKAAKE